MPTEIRYTLFRAAEVCEAVRVYKQRIGAPLPSGVVTDYVPESLAPDGDVRVRMTLARDEESAVSRAPKKLANTMSQVSIEGSALAAALILYCNVRGIPMPAKANKSLKIMDGQVCLCSSLVQRLSEVPQPGLRRPGQMRRYNDA
jgi:hypothetical protein